MRKSHAIRKPKLKLSKSELRALRARVRPFCEVERETILNALNEVGWDIAMIARLLGVGKNKIYRRLKAYGLQKPRIRRKATQVRPWHETEKKEILKAAAVVKGNRRWASALLGIGRNTLLRKLKKYRLKSPARRNRAKRGRS